MKTRKDIKATAPRFRRAMKQGPGCAVVRRAFAAPLSSQNPASLSIPSEPAPSIWAGCMANQTSADAYLGSAYNGAFTYYFCKTMRETGNRLSRRDVLSRVRSSLRFNRFDQIPQLETEATLRAARALDAIEAAPARGDGHKAKPSAPAKKPASALKSNKDRSTTMVH